MKTPQLLAPALLIALVATALLCPGQQASAQAVTNTVGANAAQPRALFITILEGEEALNDVRARTAREPIVEVRDENHRPVAGALVLFAIDNGGSGSPFASFNGLQTLTVQTGADGRAVAHGFQVTRVKGRFSVKVHALKGNAEADAVIAETNFATILSGSGAEDHVGVFAHKKVNWILATAIGGVVAGVVISSQQSKTSVTPGTGSVGAPAAVPGIHIPLSRHNR